MNRDDSLEQLVQRALAFAHAALDEPTEDRIAIARDTAGVALERAGKKTFTLSAARHVVRLVEQLRAVLDVVEQLARPAAPARAH